MNTSESPRKRFLDRLSIYESAYRKRLLKIESLSELRTLHILAIADYPHLVKDIEQAMMEVE